MSRGANFLPPFIPPHGLARWAAGLLLLDIALAWVAVGVALAQLQMVSRAAAGTAVDSDLRAAQELVDAFTLWGQSILLIASAVAFLLWFFQVRVNLRAFGTRRMRFARHWTVTGFLVPGLNAVRPYQVMAEIWQGSQPANLDPFQWRTLEVPPLVRWWWGAVLAAASLQMLELGLRLGAGPGLSGMQVAGSLAMLTDAALAVGAALAALLVWRVSDAQLHKWRKLGSAPALPAPPPRTVDAPAAVK